MTNELVTTKQDQQLVSASERLARILEQYQVDSADSYVDAGWKIKEISLKIRELEGAYKRTVEPIDEIKAKARAYFYGAIDMLKTVKSTLDRRVIAWKTEQERKEQEKREKAEREAREKERAERERLRLEAEQKEKEAEETIKKAAAAQQNGKLQTAQKLVEEAADIKEEARETKQESHDVKITPREVKTKVAPVAGLSFRTVWKFRIVNMDAIPRKYMMPDQIALGETARTDKEKASVPGVEFYSEQITQTKKEY